MKLYIALLFLMAPLANATEVGYLVGSKHLQVNEKVELNEHNPGIYIKHNGWFVGHYKNSYSNPATMVGKYKNWGNFYIMYGLVDGYMLEGDSTPYAKGNDIVPFVAPSYKIGKYVNIHMLGDAFAWSVSYSF